MEYRKENSQKATSKKGFITPNNPTQDDMSRKLW